jgi:hypothetical protein
MSYKSDVGENLSAWPDDMFLLTLPHDPGALTSSTLVCSENICFIE